MLSCASRRPVWIEVEAKYKELAIEKLQREWLNGYLTAATAEESRAAHAATEEEEAVV